MLVVCAMSYLIDFPVYSMMQGHGQSQRNVHGQRQGQGQFNSGSTRTSPSPQCETGHDVTGGGQLRLPLLGYNSLLDQRPTQTQQHVDQDRAKQLTQQHVDQDLAKQLTQQHIDQDLAKQLTQQHIDQDLAKQLTAWSLSHGSACTRMSSTLRSNSSSYSNFLPWLSSSPGSQNLGNLLPNNINVTSSCGCTDGNDNHNFFIQYPSEKWTSASEMSETSSGTTVSPGSPAPRVCKVCEGAEVVAALMPCGHHWFCMECAQGIVKQDKRCPICEEPVHGCLKIIPCD